MFRRRNSTPSLFAMRFDNANTFIYPQHTPPKPPVRQLNGGMVERIHTTKPGCGSCGK